MGKQVPRGSSELVTHSPRVNPEEENDDLDDGDYPLRPLDNINGVRAEPNRGTSTLDESVEFENYDEEEGSYLIVPEQQTPRQPYQNLSFRNSDKAPLPPRSIYQAVARWIQGPEPPRIYRIQSSEWLQAACDLLLDKCCASRWLKLGLLLLIYVLWVATLVFALPTSANESANSTSGKPVRLQCVSQLWSNSTNCGLDGQECLPFENNSFTFVCPAGCGEAQVLEPRFVGSQEVNYQSFVIGGPKDLADSTSAIYRGDSFICAAAMHAGIITNSQGGCGTLTRRADQSSFPSVHAHGITSIEFPSTFPLSFAFDLPGSGSSSCKDSRWTFLGLSVVFGSILAIFVTSAAIFFWSIFIGVFFHVALIADHPFFPDYHEMVSMAFRRFLPAAFVAQVIYKYCIHRTLHRLRAPIERAVLWLGGCWIGALNNVTFDRLPISRLTPHDLQQQPGAVVALLSIIGTLVVITVGQAWCFRIEGRMPRYLLFYGIVAALLIALILIPGMNLRIHHYILALIFLPGTSIQTRPSLLYQGILVGLFINGVARWGFDSVLQTPGQLLAGGQLGSAVPRVNQPTILGNNNIAFTFGHVDPSFAGISVLVNDVQRAVTFEPDDMIFRWTRLVDNEPEFFRFGYVSRLQLGGEWYADFTPPGQWLANGTWIPGERL